MAGVADTLGVGPEFVFEGKTYRVAPRTFEHEALFEHRVKAWALDDIRRAELTPIEYKMMMDGWRHDCASGTYTFGMPVSVAAMFSPRGQKHLVFLALNQYTPSVDMHLVDRLWADDNKWAELVDILGALNDPNRARPQSAASP